MFTQAIATKKVSLAPLALGLLTTASMMFFVQPAHAATESERVENISAQLGLVEKVVGLLSQVQAKGEVLGASSVPANVNPVLVNRQVALQEMETLSAQVTADIAMLESLSAQRADVLTQMTSLVTQIQNDQKHLADLSKDKDSLPTGTSTSVADHTQLKTVMTTLEARIKQATTMLTGVHALRADIYTRMSELRKDITTNQSRLTLLNRGVEGLNDVPVTPPVSTATSTGGTPSTTTTGTTTVSKKIPTHDFGPALKMCQRLKVMGVPGNACRQEVKEAYVELRQALALQEKIPRIAARKALFNKILKAKLLEYKKQKEAGTSTSTPSTTDGAGSADGGSSEGGSGDGGSGGGGM